MTNDFFFFNLVNILCFVAGNRGSVGKIRFYTDISLHNRPALRGFLGPGPQKRAQAQVQGFVGRTTPMAQPFCAKVKDF